MIIDRFGATYATAYQLPTYQAEDDWSISRAPVTSQVGGMSGAFDYYGSSNYPISPMTVKKAFTIVGHGGTFTGTGTITVSHSSGGHNYYDGTGTLFLSEVAIGDTITVSGGVSIVILVINDLLVEVDADHISTGVYSITHSGSSYIAVESAIDALKAATIAAGESKLWALRRDTTKRWAWAKCIDNTPPENYQNKLSVPVSLEFFCREGVWYSESTTTNTITQATTQPVAVTTAGTYRSTVLFTITSSSGTMTKFVLTNTTNGNSVEWNGSAAAGINLVLNSKLYSFLNNGVGAFSELTIGANQINYFALNAGTNSITLVVTGSTAWSSTLVRYDTYL